VSRTFSRRVLAISTRAVATPAPRAAGSARRRAGDDGAVRPSRLLLGVLPLLLAACAAAPGPVAGTPAAAAPSPEPPRPSCVDTVLAGLDRRAVAGQLVVVGYNYPDNKGQR